MNKQPRCGCKVIQLTMINGLVMNSDTVFQSLLPSMGNVNWVRNSHLSSYFNVNFNFDNYIVYYVHKEMNRQSEFMLYQ